MRIKNAVALGTIILFGTLSNCLLSPSAPDEEPSWQRVTQYSGISGQWILVNCSWHYSAQNNQSWERDSVYSISDSEEVITFNSPESNIEKIKNDTTVTGFFSVVTDTFDNGGFRYFKFVYADSSLRQILLHRGFLLYWGIDLHIYLKEDSLKIQCSEVSGSTGRGIERKFVRVR